ncbi:hypothetical protein [Pararhodobacter zhoushanensis]|uniref:DUF4760 domain-containing protein n=1 Tax=Pararhodobacter zhoushanensis TaxID=2479545 RepID=A0ABT3H491_9RHOB|nr:hypothetical protein [Pararhodobacter zhoushanensis]MCW1934515.1 hypothetical protein [Pararhodobacter zhoushanensis]
MNRKGNGSIFGWPLSKVEGVAHLVTAFGALLGAVGVILAVVQYFAAQEAERASHTLSLIDIWETRHYRDDFVALRESAMAFMASVPEEEQREARENETARANLWAQMRRHVFSVEDAERRFDRVVSFFSRLGLCIEARLCSRETALLFFDDSVSGFVSFFGPEIEGRQDAMQSYGSGMMLLYGARQ